MFKLEDGRGIQFHIGNKDTLADYRSYSRDDWWLYYYGFLVGFLDRQNYRNILQSRSQDSKLTLKILDAHGEDINGRWHYRDVDKPVLVQNWIDENDGDATGLLISACNTENREITAKKSAVIHPIGEVSVHGMIFNNQHGRLRLYLPEQGYQD